MKTGEHMAGSSGSVALKKMKKKQSGFTLVESIVAVAIFLPSSPGTTITGYLERRLGHHILRTETAAIAGASILGGAIS